MGTIINFLLDCVIVLGLVLIIGFLFFILTAMIGGLIDMFKNEEEERK